ncbi:MAG: BrnT family toxin [Calditrichia bacterium]
MEYLRFEWDKNKSRVNKNKHGISFEEAKTVFYDEYAKLIPDPDHSLEEERFILLGLSSVLRMLVVVHIYKEEDELIRIISARKATKKEITIYQR